MTFTSELWILVHFAVTIGFICWMLLTYIPYRLESSAPGELTTLGILGTFTGIFLGLVPFLFSLFLGNTDISQNIPDLIGGICVAAICSICGMFLALLSKGAQRKARAAEVAAHGHHQGATADTLADLLQELLQQSHSQSNQLSTLQKSIAGDDDSTLITQMQKIRTSVTDKQDQLIKSFNTFAEKMAKNNSEALIKALEAVIQDFNAKINEQFGDNFKQLNEAVGRLLEWQVTYRGEIEELQRQYKLCLEGIESSKDSLAVIAEKSQAMVKAADRLESLLAAYDSYRIRLAENLEAFATLSQKAENAFPIIQSNIKQLTDDLLSAVQTATNEIERSMIRTSKQLGSAGSTLTNEIEDTMDKTAKRLEEQVTALDEALQEELTKSLSSLGNQLASLSEKFVSDYTPLTTQLQKLIRAANGSNN